MSSRKEIYKMKSIEKKARKYVREKYEDYLIERYSDNTSSTRDRYYSYYSEAMEMLIAIFPHTNQDRLEAVWTAKWKKENL